MSTLNVTTVKADAVQNSSGDPLLEWEYLTGGSITTSTADLEIDITGYHADYPTLKFAFTNIQGVSDSVNFEFHQSADGGATYETGAAFYDKAVHQVIYNSGGSVISTTSDAGTLIGGIGNAAGESGWCEVILYNYQDAEGPVRCFYRYTSGCINGEGAVKQRQGVIGVGADGCDQLRFRMGSGNVDNLEWAAFGRRQA